MLSPALSPVQSAITPGLRGSSSPILNTTFIRSLPMSAILVKIPPAIRRALAPRLSPMAKPIKQLPARCSGINNRIISISTSSMHISTMPMLMPARSGMFSRSRGLRRSEANAMRLLAYVFMRTPNQATPYEPRMPITVHASTRHTAPIDMWLSNPKYSAMAAPIKANSTMRNFPCCLRYVEQVLKMTLPISSMD